MEALGLHVPPYLRCSLFPASSRFVTICACYIRSTSLNGEKLEPQRYYELLPTDVIRIGNSSREYVILAEDMA